MACARVAPLAGAWIETSRYFSTNYHICIVAPLAGAWIETRNHIFERGMFVVAPLAGAWIETIIKTADDAGLKCRAPRGRVD